MRLAAAATLLLAATGAALAQAPLTGTTGPLTAPPPPRTATPIGRGTEEVAPPATPTDAAAPAHRRRRTLQDRFEEANTTHDGHLTLEQARAKMPAVARDFAAIDTGNQGYVTIDQIKAHTRQARAARRAARAAAKPQ